MILVGGLLVTPALGIGSRLLDLIQSPPGRPEVKTPVWSPDGRRIAYFSRRDGNKDLYVVSADGSGQRRLARDASLTTLAWSPDGRKIAFESVRDGTTGVDVVNADGSFRLRMARNGARSCLVARRAEDRVRQRRQDLRHERRRERAPAPDETAEGGATPNLAWSPDGRKLAFLTDAGCGTSASGSLS